MVYIIGAMGSDLGTAVRAAVYSLDDLGDQATAKLAIQYAEEIDAGGDLVKLGAGLLAALEALLLTPRSRRATATGPDPVRLPSPLDRLRTRRNERAKAVGE